MPDQTALQTDLTPQPGKLTVSAQTMLQEFIAFFQWWYVEIPTWYVGFVKRAIILTDDMFSLSLLIKTFLVPWRRDYSWLGYGFGIAIRLLYLPFALVLFMLVVAILFAATLVWAILPVITVISILRSPFV